MTAPLHRQPEPIEVTRLNQRATIAEMLSRCSVYIAHAIDDANMDDDCALIDDFGRALTCVRHAAEIVRELRTQAEKPEGAP